ncbi:hypothetical protein POM88_050086 [Heracleum sosnowskyi]|uniref:Uncharacterized protein n=1 Tax=Heracleum sosnowskyi TaxID=360622 RepID=A0AAD8GZF7_9APIA|nr:hypothetical protein POM88_050086 [Heracleum sosnowskyi]
MPPSFSCENNDTPEAVEEIPKERKNDKENTVTLGRKLKIKAQKVRGKKRRDNKKFKEIRKSPRLMSPVAQSDDGETTFLTRTIVSGGKNNKGSFTIDNDGDNNFKETLPRKSPRKARGTTVEEKPQGKKRKNSVQSEEKNGKKQKLDKPENESEKVPGMPKKLLIRVYPSTFSKVIDGLSNAQKEWVSKVGFGSLLSFLLRAIPHEIGINFVWWFDHLNYEMSFGKDRKIKIGEEDVNDILGLPRAKKEVEYKTKKKKDDEKVQEWREKFPMRKDDLKITEKMICDAIGRSEDADLFFKQNFMVLMTNLFVRTNKSSFVDQRRMSFGLKIHLCNTILVSSYFYFFSTLIELQMIKSMWKGLDQFTLVGRPHLLQREVKLKCMTRVLGKGKL